LTNWFPGDITVYAYVRISNRLWRRHLSISDGLQRLRVCGIHLMFQLTRGPAAAISGDVAALLPSSQCRSQNTDFPLITPQHYASSFAASPNGIARPAQRRTAKRKVFRDSGQCNSRNKVQSFALPPIKRVLLPFEKYYPTIQRNSNAEAAKISQTLPTVIDQSLSLIFFCHAYPQSVQLSSNTDAAKTWPIQVFWPKPDRSLPSAIRPTTKQF